jgi:hypothetical protein
MVLTIRIVLLDLCGRAGYWVLIYFSRNRPFSVLFGMLDAENEWLERQLLVCIPKYRTPYAISKSEY